MAIGMASWTVAGARRSPQAPVLLRGCSLHPTDPTHRDYDIDLSPAVELNPVLVHYLASEQGIALHAEALAERPDIQLVDHGAGKSYLGFILHDLFFKQHAPDGRIHGIETRDELVMSSRRLADKLGFAAGMRFQNLTVAESITSDRLPARIDIVTALHACNTATDDAIRFALKKGARAIVLVPCCQAEVAAELRKHKQQALRHPIAELWRHPIHTREFGSHVTNVLRCLQLEAHGYEVTVTELVGWEHSMKNELIVARHTGQARKNATERLAAILHQLNLEELRERFIPQSVEDGEE